MKKLEFSKRAFILRCISEGNSLMSTARITGCSKNTVAKIMCWLGEACADYQKKHLVNLACKSLQLDEIWSFCGCKDANKSKAKMDHPGDVWTWTAACVDFKLIVAWFVGDRSMNSAYQFCGDLSNRVQGPVQITTDGLQSYKWAVKGTFKEVDMAMYIKTYTVDSRGRNVVKNIRKERVLGNPDMAKASTSCVERTNLTIRMTNRRFTRLTNAFSKKLENHVHMLALTLMCYNFCFKHSTLKMTPAMAAGVCDHQWSMDEVVQMAEQYHQQREDAKFEATFNEQFLRPRNVPKTFEPTPKDQIPVPWYLDSKSGGPNPGVKKEGIAYDPQL